MDYAQPRRPNHRRNSFSKEDLSYRETSPAISKKKQRGPQRPLYNTTFNY